MRFLLSEQTTLFEYVMDFQFSLWDSKIIKIPISQKTTLSILFMRFLISLASEIISVALSFNSLYEIHSIKLRRMDWINTLSILFMRFFYFNLHLTLQCLSFNSLYEILTYLFLLYGLGQRNFQFSLWDSLSDFDPSGEEIYNFQFSLWDSSTRSFSSLFSISSFNSLYEILLFSFWCVW